MCLRATFSLYLLDRQMTALHKMLNEKLNINAKEPSAMVSNRLHPVYLEDASPRPV